MFFNLPDKTCNISTISKMNAQRIEVDERAGRRRRGKKEKKKNRGEREADGYCKLNSAQGGLGFSL